MNLGTWSLLELRVLRGLALPKWSLGKVAASFQAKAHLEPA